MASSRCVTSRVHTRLCFQAALSMAVCLLLHSAAANDRQAWEYSKTADPMQGGSIAIASVTSENVQAMVRCWTKTGELDVSFLLTPGTGRVNNESIMIGFDQRRDAQRTWRVSSNGLALVVPRAQRSNLLQRMQDAGNMRISLATSNDTAAQLQVPLAGSSRAIGSVLKVCS